MATTHRHYHYKEESRRDEYEIAGRHYYIHTYSTCTCRYIIISFLSSKLRDPLGRVMKDSVGEVARFSLAVNLRLVCNTPVVSVKCIYCHISLTLNRYRSRLYTCIYSSSHNLSLPGKSVMSLNPQKSIKLKLCPPSKVF